MPICWDCNNENNSTTDILCPECLHRRGMCRCCLEVHPADLLIDGVCPTCFNRLYEHCQDCGRLLTLGSGREGQCQRCFSRTHRTCDQCQIAVTLDNSFRSPNNENLCSTCFHEQCGICGNCGDTFWQCDMHDTSHGLRCPECDPEGNEWESIPFEVAGPHYDVIGSSRRYGIELETHNCRGHRTLFGNTLWECKSDCSIEGKEFVSPILYGDEGLSEIENFCAIAESKRWTTNHYCGYHAHFDASRESWDSLRSIAYAYGKLYHLWCRLVPEDRATNPYCGQPAYDLSDIIGINNLTDWEYFVGARDRFEFVNWRAYLVHGSIEVRSHGGSLDPVVICNWIKVHARFIDRVSAMDIFEINEKFGRNITSQFKALTDFVGEDLGDYYAAKAESYETPVRAREVTHLEGTF